MVTVALQPWDGWQVPGWDDWWVLDSRQMDLAHQAVLLRLCRLVLEQGFSFLAIPVALACAILKLEILSQKFRFVHVMYGSLKLVVFFGVLLCALPVILDGYSELIPAACETQWRKAWLGIVGNLGVFAFALPFFWSILACIMWRFDKDWNAVPVDFGAERMQSN